MDPFSADISLWKEHLRPLPDGFVKSITHFTSLTWFNDKYLSQHHGFIMSTNQPTKAFVYGENVCKWASLQHQTHQPQELEILNNKTVKQVVYNDDCFVILTEDGLVYSSGKCLWNRDQGLKLLNDSDQCFERISCGYGHLLLLTNHNELMAMGRNDCGQITGTRYSLNKMIRINVNNVVRIDCGRNHSLALTNSGKVYSWGSNEHGQLGLSERRIFNQPIMIDFPDSNDNQPKEVIAGPNHSLFLMENGTVYGCGIQRYSRVEPQLSSESKPWRIPLKNATAITSGWSYPFTIAFTSVGLEDKCWFWGVSDQQELSKPTLIERSVESFSEASKIHFPMPLTFGWTTNIKQDVTVSCSSNSISFWKQHLHPIPDDFLQSIVYLISLQYFELKSGSVHNGYIMSTFNKQTFVYGSKVCDWLSLEHQDGQPQPIKDLDDKNVIQVDYGWNHFAILLEDGSVYLGGHHEWWKTFGNLKRISNDEQRFKRICCGGSHLLLLTSDNKLMGMGCNCSGQITGTGESYESMRDTGLEDVVQMNCGVQHALALTKDGKVYAWGFNKSGQLGLGSDENQSIPTLITFFDSIDIPVKDIVAGSGHSLFLLEDGTLYGCGLNKSGQLGSKVFGSLAGIPDKLDIEKKIRAVQSGWSYDFTIASTFENVYYLWGKLDQQQLLVMPTETSRQVESFQDAYYDFYSSASGPPVTFGWLCLAKKRNDLMNISKRQLWLWNKHLKTIQNRFLKSVTHFIRINPIDRDREEHDHGYLMSNHQNQTFAYGEEICKWLSLEHQPNQPQEVEVLATRIVRQVGYGWNYLALLIDDGSVYLCSKIDSEWNTCGGLKLVNRPKQLFKQISCGCKHLLLLTTNDELMAMGSNDYGQITGTGNSYETIRDTGLKNVIKMVCGCVHSLALTSDGKVFSWGNNNQGRLGLCDQKHRDKPTPIPFFNANNLHPVQDLFVNYKNSFFLLQNGDLYGCGLDREGELGLKGFFQVETTPRKIPIENVTAMTSGWCFLFTLAFTTDNYCHLWGRVGDRINRTPYRMNMSPIESFSEASSAYLEIPTTFGWTGIVKSSSTAYDQKIKQAFACDLSLWQNYLQPISNKDFLQSLTHFIAMNFQDSNCNVIFNGFIMATKQKQIFAYGHNVCEWLSLEYQVGQPQPIQNLDNQNVIQIVYGYHFFAILLKDGSVHLGASHSVWDTDGKLRRLSNDKKRFKQISAGCKHLLLLTNENNLIWMSGRITGTGESSVSIRDIGLENVVRIDCGVQHSLALTEDGKVYSWGSNWSGQLGLGDLTDQTKPTLIKFFDSINVPVKDFAGGFSHSLFLLEDGTLYGCGSNRVSELGLEDGDILTPVKLPLENILAVVSLPSSRFSIALTMDNCFYMWGTPDDQIIKKPTKTPKPVESFSEASSLYFVMPFTFGWHETLAISNQNFSQ